jgi:glyoxylase-like metal-dependent hydrolase (beta-lactamase superfamily II)
MPGLANANRIKLNYSMVDQILVGLFGTNCYIYSENGSGIIIDPGGDADKIISRLTSLNLVPGGIALTHGHIDHTEAIGKLVDHYKQRGIHLKIAVHEKDSKYLGAEGKTENEKLLSNLGLSGFSLGGFTILLPEADIIFQEGSPVFDTSLLVLETPGHTEGGCCFYSRQQGVLFSGDTLFAQGIGRADLPGGNASLLINGIRTRLFCLPPETEVYPGHGPKTTIGAEMRDNPFL